MYKEQLLACFLKFRLLRLGRSPHLSQWPLGESLPMFEERAAYLALAITAALGPKNAIRCNHQQHKKHIVSCSCHKHQHHHHHHHHHHRKKDTPTPSTTHVQVPQFRVFCTSCPFISCCRWCWSTRRWDEKAKAESWEAGSKIISQLSSIIHGVICDSAGFENIQHQSIFWKEVL